MSSSFTNDFHHHLPSSSSSDQHRRLSVNNGIHIRQPVSAVTSTSTVVAGQLPFRFPASSSADSPSSLPRAVISSNDNTFSSSLDVDPPMVLAQARSSGRHLPYQFPFTAQPTTATTQPPRNPGLSAASDFAQYINASPLQHMGANTFPFPASSSSNNAVSAPSGGNYLLGTPRSAASTSSSSFGTTPSSFTSDSFSAASPTHHSGTDAVADAYPSYNNISTAAHSLPSANALQSPSFTSPVAASAMPVSWAGPSSAPPAPAQWEAYIAPDEMMIGSPGMTGFYAGMSGLGIDANVKRHDSMGTISPRDVHMGSATVIDNDDFSNAGSPTAASVGRDYPAVAGFGGQRSNGGFSSSYPGYSSGAADYSLDLGFSGVSNSPIMFGGYSNNLFANSPQFGTAVPPHQHQSPTMDMATQFNLDLDGDFAKPSLIDANKTPHATIMSFDTSPTHTIRGPKKSSKPELAVAVDSVLSVKFENGNTPTMSWPLSARPLRKSARAFDDDAVDEEEEDDEDEDNADDDDYVDEPHHHGAGPHRTARRMSSTAVTPTTPTSNPKPRRPSPYSRSARPSSTNVRRLSHPASERDRPAAATLTPKKVKSVKWESTKPKYWIPEGFDPWWDQKSRGRGVATVSSSAPAAFEGVGSDHFVNDGTFVDSSASWPANYLPEDWRELVRGKGNPARPFVCPAVNCGKTFQRSEHAKRHAWSLHTPDAVKVSCPFEGCDHKSTRGDNLKQHIGSHKRKSGSAAALRRRSEGGANGARRKVKYEEEGDDDETTQWA